MALLFEYGVIKAEAVIAWTDLLIVQLNPPPQALLELSTTAPDKTADILSCLRRLATGADFWEGFRSILPELHEYILKNSDRAEDVANMMYLTACRFHNRGIPSELKFINSADVDFSLAHRGAYGWSAAYARFLENLKNAGQRK